MSRIDDLIEQLAPGGICYRELGAVAAYSTTRVDAAELDATNFVGVDNLLPNKQGKVDASYLPNTARLTAYQEGDLLLGNIRPYLKKVWLATNAGGCSGDVLALRIFAGMLPMLLPEFLFYLLSSDSFFAYSMQHAKGAKMPRGNKEAIMRYRIPVPPLEVQHEIVRILDTFTELETELEAELEARRRQYDHYRSQILDLGEDVAWRPLREVAEVRSGWGFPHSYQGQTDGDLPFFKVSDMNSPGNETVMYSSSNYVSRAVARTLGARPTPEGTVIFPKIGAAVATNKKRLLAVQSVYDNNVMGLVPGNRLEPRFLYYWMTTIDLSRLAHNSGAVPSIRASEMAAFRIPVPELTAQREIASTLDKFNAMISDLSVGLPAELAARRRQYEYYRDRLLTFQEAAS